MRSRSSASLAAMAIVKLDSGARAGSSPHSLYTGHAEPLAGEIVQRRADRRLDRAVEAERAIHLRFDVLEGPRVELLDDRRQPRQRGERGVRRLAVESIRRGLAPPFDAVAIGDANANQAMLARAAARDDERMGRADDRDVVLNLHFDRRLARRAVSALRSAGAASGADCRNPMSASARS